MNDCEHLGSTGYLKEPAHCAEVIVAAGNWPTEEMYADMDIDDEAPPAGNVNYAEAAEDEDAGECTYINPKP